MDKDIEDQYITPVPTPRKIRLNDYQLNHSSCLSFNESNNQVQINITENLLHNSYPIKPQTPMTPRRPRSRSQTLNRIHHNNRRFNDYSNSSTSSMRQLLLTPSFQRHQRDGSNSHSSLYLDNDKNKTRSLQRPNAPPPPPPPPPIGFTAMEFTTNELEKHLLKNLTIKKYQEQRQQQHLQFDTNSFNFYGFENLVYKADSSSSSDGREHASMLVSSSDSVHEIVKPLQPTIKKQQTHRNTPKAKNTKAQTRQNHFNYRLWCKLSDIFILVLTLLLLFSCVTFIILFQTHVHQYYKQFFNDTLNDTTQMAITEKKEKILNKTEIIPHEPDMYDEDPNGIYTDTSTSEEPLTTYSTSTPPNLKVKAQMRTIGSKLIDQTVLFCNSPYFTYAISNLVVVPFSLTLILIFSFFSKRDSCLPNRCGGRPGIPASINPFLKRNRFVSAALFCILANEIFKMIESSIFDNSPYSTHKTFNSTNELLKYIAADFKNSSNFELTSIGFGIEPNSLKQQQQRLQAQNTTTQTMLIYGPSVVRYSKPKLPPRLELSEDFYLLQKARLLNEQRKKLRLNKNKTDKLVDNLNDTLANINSNELVRHAYDLSFKLPSFKWSILSDKLETIAIILVEVLVIGFRYYPLLGILDKDSIICLGVAAIYMWLDICYNLFTSGLCEGLKLNKNFELLKDLEGYFEPYIHFSTFRRKTQNKKILFSSNRIFYTVIKSLPHFFCLSYVTIRLTSAFVRNVRKRFLRKINTNKKCIKKSTNKNSFVYLGPNMFESPQLTYMRNLNFYDDTMRRYRTMTAPKRRLTQTKLTFEQKYVEHLFKQTKNFIELKRIKEKYALNQLSGDRFYKIRKAFAYAWSKVFWTNDKYFRFSTNIICTYTVCCTVLYYLTCIIVFYATTFIESLYIIPTAYKATIIFSVLFTAFLTIVQLFYSLKKIRSHLMGIYKGHNDSQMFNFTNLTRRQNERILLNSFNYSGYAVTHTCCGFMMLLMLVIFLSLTSTTVYLYGNTRITLFFLLIIMPFLFSAFVINFFSQFLGRCIIRLCFVQRRTRYLTLKNHRFYSFYLYFKFFYDCFTGIAVCFKRMIKTFLLSIIFMSRLDHSFMGRSLETNDPSYMSYVGYLYWESQHTNSICIAFSNSLYESSSDFIYMHTDEKLFYLRRNRILNRWHLLRLLSQNKCLIQYRKHNLNIVKN